MTERENKLRRQINENVPHAPKNSEEVGQRLSLALQRIDPSRGRPRPSAEAEAVPTIEVGQEGIWNQPAIGGHEAAMIAGADDFDEVGSSSFSYGRTEDIPNLADAAKTAVVQRSLLAARETARKSYEMLTTLHYSSDNGEVKATVDGHGSLLGLEIHRTAGIHRLGESVADAVVLARSEVEGAFNRELVDEGITQEVYDEIAALVIAAPERVDFGTLDRTESVESRDIVAQGIERQHRLSVLAQQVDRMQITVDSEAIRVIRGRDSKTLKVHIPRQLIRDIGIDRVADRTVHAINEADRLARAEKIKHFNAIQMYGFCSDPRTTEVLKLVLGD